jgi:UDP-glucose 4-epimerase
LYDATIEALGIVEAEEVEVRERNPDDVFSILLDPSKTNQDFSWKASTPLIDGVAQAIQYYKKFGISETYTHLKVS